MSLLSKEGTQVVALAELKNGGSCLYFSDLSRPNPSTDSRREFLEANYFNKVPSDHLESVSRRKAV